MAAISVSDLKAQAEAAIRAGDPAGALTHLTAAVRAAPGDASLRIFLSQLLCVLGQWSRAHTQLNVSADLDASAGPMRETVGYAIRSELVRAKVFAGERTPMVLGDPDPWLAQLIESLQQQGQGDTALAAELAGRAFDDAPVNAGDIDGAPFEWLADADSRIGPVLEACVNGKYFWIPFTRLATIEFEAPVDLRDVVWLPAQLAFHDGGSTVALVPVRYVDAAQRGDAQTQLARKTEWLELGSERWAGLGQRLFASDGGEHPILGIRRIRFVAPASSTPAAAGG